MGIPPNKPGWSVCVRKSMPSDYLYFRPAVPGEIIQDVSPVVMPNVHTAQKGDSVLLHPVTQHTWRATPYLFNRLYKPIPT